MPDLVLLLAHVAPSLGPRYAAAVPPAVRVVPFTSPYPGLSSAYDALARELRDADGRLLPGLRRWLALRAGAPFAGPVALGWYSAGYALARALAQHPADRAEVAGWIGIDGMHAGLDPDGTADDRGVAWLSELARAAADGGTPLWLGHTDVRTAGYASTTQVAAELRRLAGEPRGRWHLEAHDVARDDAEEHRRAVTDWGMDLVARACVDVLEGASESAETARVLRRGDRGPDVALWQERLHQLGVDPGAVDADFGVLTERATKAFQVRAGLPASGIVDAATLASADHAARAQPLPVPHPEVSASLAEALRYVAAMEFLSVVRETAPNDGPRIREYLRAVGVDQPAAWCAAFVTWCLRTAAGSLGVKPPIAGSAGAKALGYQLQRAGRWLSAEQLRANPSALRPGLILVWHRGAPASWTGHTGILARVEGGRFWSIEGNAGDRVAEMDHSIDEPALIGAGWVD